jgi:hypothetical protein
MQSFVRGKISPNMLLSEAEVAGAILIGTADELAKLWEVAEASYFGMDRRYATGYSVVSIGKLTGTWRNPPHKGLVTMRLTVQWPTGTRIEPGSIIVSEQGNTSNTWTNRDWIEIASHTMSGGEIVPQYVTAIFISTLASSLAKGPAESLTNITTKLDGLLAAINLLDAEPGDDVESIEALRLRGELMVGQTATTTADGIQAAIAAIPGVISCSVETNNKDSWEFGIPPHSIRVNVWDGVTPQANNAEICNVIYKNLPPGTGTCGDYSTVVTTASDETETIYFARCNQVPVEVEFVGHGNIAAETVAALVAEYAQPAARKPLYASSIIAAALRAGCEYVDTPLIGIQGTTRTAISALQAGNRDVLVLDSSRMIVSIS